MSHMPHVPHFLRRGTTADPAKPDKKGRLAATANTRQSIAPIAESSAAGRGVGIQIDAEASTRLPSMSALGAKPPTSTAPAPARPRNKSDSIPLPPPLPNAKKRHYHEPADILHHRPPSSGSNHSATSPMSITSPTVASVLEFPALEDTASGSNGRRGYTGSSPEEGMRSVSTFGRSGQDGSTSPKSRSPPGSPKSYSSMQTIDDGMGGQRRHTASMKSGSSGGYARDSSAEDERRRRTKSERNRASPLAKRLGEEPPFILPHPSKQGQTSQQYPGVVLGQFAGGLGGPALGFGEHSVGFDDGSMDDILDFSAPRQDGRHDSTTGLAPNIAPWLAEAPSLGRETGVDTSASGATTPNAHPGLAHSSSNASLPRIKRGGDLGFDGGASASSSRSGSHADIFPVPPPEEHQSNSSDQLVQSRHGSTDSVQTLSGYQLAASQKKRSGPSPTDGFTMPGGGRGSVANNRLRLGSTVSTMSSGSNDSTKKKGFLGGLLKRKPTGVPMAFTDFSPPDGSHRGSGSGSASSRMSTSTSIGSLSHQRSYPEFSPISPTNEKSGERSYFAEELASPTEERSEMDFHLDMNLDDMEGIVDPTLANAPPQAPPAPTALPAGQTSTFSSLGLQGASPKDGPASVSRDGSSGGSSGSAAGPSTGRQVIGEADRNGQQFSRPNPFSQSPTSSIDGRINPPPSPQNLSPKNVHPFMGLNNQPRRPSQLRNVKVGSFDSEASTEAPDSALQPLAPAWAASSAPGQTVFNDPFGGSRPRTSDGSPASQPAASTMPTPHAALEATMLAPPLPVADGQAPAIAPPGLAAWAAPESWGVEADEDEVEDEEGDDETSSDDQAAEWTVTDQGTASEGEETDQLASSPRKPPPFGHGSMGRGSSTRGRPRTGAGRPSTSSRVDKGRPGTSGSIHVTNVPHWVRIYRADGTYTVMAFPLLTTTADLINTLSGANEAPQGKKVPTSMKLYLRERGQDRMLLPAEKPLVIQELRLRQAGYTDAEKIEELGKGDLAILCKFIYQTPVLPVMDPDEENHYDSFEFIDIANRDLQTIPIFLHLHAHNIIILNISRNPMTDIPLDFIQACTALKELRMSNNALKRIPGSIRFSKSLSRLDVSSNRIADLESVNLHEVATLLSLKVQNNILTSIPTYFAQMRALKYLNISNNKFVTFPAVVCEMGTLVDLDVSFNNIAELPSEMSNLKSLEKLAVFGNDLSTFPKSFSTLANLRDLDVRRNKLSDLAAVYALPNLTRLQADWNNIVTLDAQIGAKVKIFSVPHNSITRFTLAPIPGATAVTYSLATLNLSHAKISTLADEAFSGLVNLVELNLNFNQFTRLPATLDRLTNLEIFSCTDNMLNDLPMGFGKMQKLRVLNVHNNNLRTLPPDIWGCGSLERLNASSNLLQQFEEPPDDLVSMMGPAAASTAARKMSIIQEPGAKLVIPVPPAGQSLEKLFLADNSLNDDVFHQIAQMPNLQVLNLSFNDIYEIPPGTLPQVNRLEALYLSGNKLTSLPSEDLDKLQRLQILHLNGNKLQTLPSELGAIKTLQHLDVGSNVLKYNIANWPYDWNWNWNTALRYLNLSGNKRLEIKPTSAQEMSHTPALRKELSDFTALTHLRILGLMDVTLRISTLPDESELKRVRTSFAEVNELRYGIADMLGTNDHLALFDMVTPNFRGRSDECLFGMFGQSIITNPSGTISKYLQETFAKNLVQQLDILAEGEDPVQALRRCFLLSNRKTFDFVMDAQDNRKRSVTGFANIDNLFKNWSPSLTSPLRTGASAAIAYLKGKTLYIGNVGANLVVISRKGEAELLSKLHDPTEREETARIRTAEAWVSPKGLINEDKELDVSRAFGYWHQFPAVNAAADVRVRQLAESDEFLIIGNRSLWNCCSYQTAVDIARTERDDPMMAAQKLRDFAISYGAEGSVMVMVVNISDLFFSRNQRSRALTGAPAPDAGDGDQTQGARRNLRRRYEEVGDRTLNRLQQEIEPPQGQVAIVFTDIVNSTHLWETNPGMPTSIKIHHNLMRRQLRLDGGYEVKTEGDSFMVSFQNVLSALLWAFNCQILLLQQEWPRELLDAHDGKIVHDSEGNIVQRGLRVRMGVHWGAPNCERDPITRRMDYYGPMVNRAARINASADGGQLMASQDVISELQEIREYLDDLGEEGVKDLPSEMTRELQELRRIGLEVKFMGERKLKGLEVPEKLHLLYPKLLAGRFEISPNIAQNVEVQAPPVFVREPNFIDVDEVRQLVLVCLRLEALTSPASPAASPSPPSPRPLSTPMLISSPSMDGTSPQSKITRRSAPPVHLGPAVRDEMTDDELSLIIESLTTRIENSLSTLFLKQLGGFSSVLAALEQATKIDQRMLVHALTLMNGAMNGSAMSGSG